MSLGKTPADDATITEFATWVLDRFWPKITGLEKAQRIADLWQRLHENKVSVAVLSALRRDLTPAKIRTWKGETAIRNALTNAQKAIDRKTKKIATSGATNVAFFDDHRKTQSKISQPSTDSAA
jgi:hypothetical protein